MKTPISELQEMMMKINVTPQYEYTAQAGPQHQAMFEYRCTLQGLSVSGLARSKKEAKQEAARAMLHALAARGDDVPAPYTTHAPPATSQKHLTHPRAMGQGKSRRRARSSSSSSGASSSSGSSFQAPRSHRKLQKRDDTFASGSGVQVPSSTGSRSYVALLRELCEEYRLPALADDLVSDTGPPHARHFTVRVYVGMHARVATSTTKKAARQLAAEQLYMYLKDHLARVTKDFVEEDALVRARDKAMERFAETREDGAWRPDLGQRIADYHLGLVTHIDEKKCEEGAEALEELRNVDSVLSLDTVAALLGLRVEWDELPTVSDEALCVVQLVSTAPALAWAGLNKNDAAHQALDYLRHGLAQKPNVADVNISHSTER